MASEIPVPANIIGMGFLGPPSPVNIGKKPARRQRLTGKTL
jgi:hypothetical protein